MIRDYYWTADDGATRVHVPVSEDDNTVILSYEALSHLLVQAGYQRTD